MSKKSWSIDYSNVDWSQSNAAISKQLMIHPSSVASKRKSLGMPPSSRKRNEGIEELENGVIIDWDNSIRFKKGKYNRIKIRISCSQCKIFRFTTATTINKIRRGYLATCKKCRQELRAKNSKTGKAGYYINSSGYMIRTKNTFSPEEQLLLKPMFSKKRQDVLEHRAIMALGLGRILTIDEIVHHVDGNKINNKLENLELTNRNKHTQSHRDILKELIQLKAENKKLNRLLQDV